jgi:predicted Zn-dependent protease
LLPIRYKSNVFGGSYAQRDVIALTLIEAALRAGRFKLAHALMAERTAVKETSPMNWKLMGRALDGLGDTPGGDDARGRAEDLLAGVRPITHLNTGLRNDPVFIPGGCLL